jgi:3D (Asp-Asp-Asp) domain-containing protein
MHTQDTKSPLRGRRPSGTLVRVAGLVGVAGMVALSAVVTKEAVGRATLRPLVDVETTAAPAPTPVMNVGLASVVEVSHVSATVVQPATAPAPVVAPVAASSTEFAESTDIRYFNGRPVRVARVIKMVVTAYSPDEKSCGPDARGITSSLHHVSSNAMKLVAADSRVLPLGSMITVPGYDAERVVPVLDRGGAIKGNRLDVLFPTDAAARAWGVKTLDVAVWEYADNLPADDFRAIRDSRN